MKAGGALPWPQADAPDIGGNQGEAFCNSSVLKQRPCRTTLRRALRKKHICSKVDAVGQTLRDLEFGVAAGDVGFPDHSLSAAEYEHIHAAVARMGQPPDGISARGAFEALQGSSP